jgi:hypothetical protein
MLPSHVKCQTRGAGSLFNEIGRYHEADEREDIDGGLKGGKARAEKLSPEQRKEIVKKAAQSRWSK